MHYAHNFKHVHPLYKPEKMLTRVTVEKLTMYKNSRRELNLASASGTRQSQFMTAQAGQFQLPPEIIVRPNRTGRQKIYPNELPTQIIILIFHFNLMIRMWKYSFFSLIPCVIISFKKYQ